VYIFIPLYNPGPPNLTILYMSPYRYAILNVIVLRHMTTRKVVIIVFCNKIQKFEVGDGRRWPFCFDVYFE